MIRGNFEVEELKDGRCLYHIKDAKVAFDMPKLKPYFDRLTQDNFEKMLDIRISQFRDMLEKYDGEEFKKEFNKYAEMNREYNFNSKREFIGVSNWLGTLNFKDNEGLDWFTYGLNSKREKAIAYNHKFPLDFIISWRYNEMRFKRCILNGENFEVMKKVRERLAYGGDI